MSELSLLQPLLKQILDRKGYTPRLKAYEAWRHWDKTVGPQVAQQAQPLRFREGVLEVRVNHPVWMQQLSLLKPRLIKQLNQHLGEKVIRDIYFRRGQVAPPPAQPPEDPRPWRKETLSPEAKKAIEDQLQHIEEGELKKILRRLLTQEKQLKKYRTSS